MKRNRPWESPGAGLLGAVALGTVALAAAAIGACAEPGVEIGAALQTIGAADLGRHIETLSSDAFEGRAPASPGEDRTIAYLETELERIGLRPGNGDSWFQEVPLVSITADPEMPLRISGGGRTETLAYGDDFIGWTTRVIDRAELADSEMIFVGYGIVAPEYGWDDYRGVDVVGKTVVTLVNDPGFATSDPGLFNGRSMTYYGRWTYRYEEAARQGAAAVLLVHETEAAGYPWDVVSSSWSGPQFGLVAADANLSRVAVEGWITVDAAREIFGQAGLDYDELRERSKQVGFEAVPMGLTASIVVENRIERTVSRNVLALLPGSNAADEVVVFMAHWDHLGRDPTLEGDQIYNGALDNATGTAGLIELAEAFASLETAPSRSLLFLATTAEEQGLLGSAYYAANPVYPLAATVAAINLDGLDTWGSMNDITVVGHGNSDLDDYLAEAATARGRVLRPDPESEKGFFYRSDHFPFAKAGVPALYTDAGIDHVEFGESWGVRQRDIYTAEKYHKPSDEYDPGWDLSGAVEDLQLLFEVGHRLAVGTSYPNWREGNEFRARRDSMMSGR